ncbi:MAG: ParB/RepB/Spo0J family partition protein, partial [Nitrosopumilaceae archaeon]
MVKIVELPIEKLEPSPWHFRLISDHDFELLVNHIKDNGIDAISNPVIAAIGKKHYIVDGHGRVSAAANAGFKTIQCRVADWIQNYSDLRLWSFRLNRHGYSNPLTLSDMINEDMKIVNDAKTVASSYGVNEDYIETLMKINSLHDDTKVLMQKILTVSNRKYQFLLEQITPAHFSNLAELDSEKQIEVLDWIFHDVMYGPADESLLSIPSVFEIINEIEKVKYDKEKKTYRKRDDKHNITLSEIPLTCRCGAKYDVDLKSYKIYEYYEQNN